MWIFYAIVAAMLWGMTYVLNEQIYKHISISTLMFISSAISTIIYLIVSITQKSIRSDMQTILDERPVQGLIIVSIVVIVLAEFAIALSITNKNAAIAGLVEISYPVFIALFGYVLFREYAVGVGTIAGALLIFSGIFVVYHFNQ